MFQIFSDLTQCLRKEYNLSTVTPDVLASGLTGSWVTLDSVGNAKLTSGATGLAWPIWNESYRDGSIGKFTPDVVNSKRVSVIVGKIFATTDRVKATGGGTGIGDLAIGDPLTTYAGGVLSKATIGTHPIVAYVVKASYTTTYFGNTYTVIDIQTV